MKKTQLLEAEKFLKLDHVGEALKECFEKLISVVRTLDKELSDLSAGSADVVLLKRRHDQLKKDFRDIERKFEKFNEKVVPTIAIELKNIITQLPKAGEAAEPIKESAQKIAGTLKDIN